MEGQRDEASEADIWFRGRIKLQYRLELGRLIFPLVLNTLLQIGSVCYSPIPTKAV
jgi:hypothetical protein